MDTTQIYEATIRAYKGQHSNVAKVFFLMFHHRVCAKLHDTGKVLIFYRDTIESEWKETNHYVVRKLLSTKVASKFNEVAISVFNKAFNSTNELIKPYHLEVAYSLLKVSNRLQNNTYKGHITKAVLELIMS